MRTTPIGNKNKKIVMRSISLIYNVKKNKKRIPVRKI